MSTSLLLQYFVIAVALLLSVWVVAKKQFPGSLRKLRVAIALRLLGEGRPAWMQSVGRRVSPVKQTGADGCGGCDSCGPKIRL